jgi:hypothetical protein
VQDIKTIRENYRSKIKAAEMHFLRLATGVEFRDEMKTDNAEEKLQASKRVTDQREF